MDINPNLQIISDTNQITKPNYPFGKIFIIVVAFLIVALSSIVAYLYGKNEITHDNVTRSPIAYTDTDTPEIFPTIEPTKINDKFVGWNLYKNDYLGYWIKYPQNWYVDDRRIYEKSPANNISEKKVAYEEKEVVFIENQLPQDLSEDLYAEPYILNSGNKLIILREKNNKLPLEESDTYFRVEKVTLNGLIAIKITNILSLMEMQPRTKYYIPRADGSLLSVSFPNNDFQGNHDSVYDDMLESLSID